LTTLGTCENLGDKGLKEVKKSGHLLISVFTSFLSLMSFFLTKEEKSPLVLIYKSDDSIFTL